MHKETPRHEENESMRNGDNGGKLNCPGASSRGAALNPSVPLRPALAVIKNKGDVESAFKN